MPFSSLIKIVRQYHNSVNGQQEASHDGAAGSLQASAQDGALEASFSESEMKSARWAWDWLRKQSQITINQDKRYKGLRLEDVLALPEADDTPTQEVGGGQDEAQQAPPPTASRKNAKGKESKKTLTHRPRIFPTEELLWQTIAHHGVDYKRIPVLEWKCLVGIASARHEGILQSDLRRLVDQDKRSLPKRTDSLAKKGYIAKRTIIANKMKTSKLWLLRFAPAEPENTKTKTGLDLAPETLTMNLDPVPWHVRWTGDGVDVEAHARTIVAIVKAWGVLRYCDLRSKMGVGGQTARMKTLAKACQRFVDMGVLKYTAAAFAGARKIFKDCLKFIREPTMDEWQEFLATGKKTSVYSDASRHRQPKSNALALTGKPGQNSANKNQGPVTTIRVFPGWSPDAPLTQFVFEVVRSAGPTGASNPQVSIATIGYSFRRYMASLLAKLAEANQPPHLKKFQVESKLVRSGKTSAYMFSVSKPLIENSESAPPAGSEEAQPASDESVKQGTPASTSIGSRHGFGAIRAKAFPNTQALSLSELCKPVKRPAAYQRRRGGMISEAKRAAMDATSSASRTVESTPAPDVQLREPTEPPQVISPEGAAAERERLTNIPIEGPPGAFLGEPGSLHPRGRGRRRPVHTIVVIIRLQKLKDPSFWESLQPKPVNDGVLDVRFDGIAGKLELDPTGESIKFVGTGESEGVPLTVRIDSLMGAPFIQDDPTSSDKSLVLVTATTDEEGPSQTHAFRFDNDEKSLSKAVAFQQKISNKKPVAIAPQPEPTTASPARGGACGGRGGRGRGGARGRGGKKGQAGGAVWKCDKCGGTWKNDIGLKYHLTKAQTPCNPDFDPASLLEKARKRRQATLAPPLSSGPPSVTGDDESTGRAAKRRKQKHIARGQVYATIRSAMRGRPDIEHAFRGFVEEESESDSDQPIAPSRELASTDSKAVPAKRTGEASVLETGAARFLPSTQFSGLYVSSAIKPATWDSNTPAPPVASSNARQQAKAKAVVDALTKVQPAIHKPQAQPSSLTASETTLRTTPSLDQNEVSVHNGRIAVGLLDLFTNRGAGSALEETHSDYPPLLGEDDEQNDAVNAGANAPTPAVGSTTSHQELPEFMPSYSYDRILSESKKRTAQAADIIQYLLDNNHGVFPGDKALFYALTKVFLREFMGEVPPTWKNFHAAMRILESQKLAMVHTHMLHENGRRHACTMFVRTGVDPNGPIPTAMRQKMKDVYPSIYIPPAFSPTMEELAMLEELDKKPEERDRADRGRQKEGASGDKDVKQNRNGNKFRSRRKIDEVEVFNAPYYTRNMQAEPTPPPGDVNSYFANLNALPTKDSELTASPGTPRKRPAAADLSFESPSAKKQRQHYNKALELNIDPILARFPTDPRPKRRDDNSEPRRAFKTQASLPGTGIMSTEPRSVVDAIRTYGLLPSRTGRRKRRDSMAGSGNMGKIPSELGWARNPGLSSLPQSFWGNMEPFGGRPPEGQASVRFLAPNTHLGDEAGGEGAGGEEGRPLIITNNKPPAEVLPIDPALINVDEHTDQEAKACVFVNPMALGDSTPGTWPGLDLHYFELNQEASFALQGWMPDRVKLLLENLPKSAEEMAKRNRGQPWKITDSWLDQEWARFWLSVSRIKTWELSQHGSNLLLLGGSIAPEHIYINVSPSIERSSMKPVTLQWSEGTQYTLDTLPYEYLDDDDDMDDISYVARMPTRKVGRPKKVTEPKQRKRQRIAKVTEKTMGMVRGSKFKLPAIKTGRELTAFPRSEEDFLRAPGDDSLQLDWTSENVKLTAFVVITTLLGGVDRIVDWGLMLRLFPDLTISQLRHLWGDLKKDRQSTIVNLTDKFRKAYLKAYKNNELPSLDYNNTAAYDWKTLVKWALKLDNTQRADIPASLEEVQTKYTLDDCQYANREWRESYYHPQRSVFNRFQDASSDALACPAEPTPAPAQNADMLLALSWTRSLCVTPIDTYPTDMVIKRRESLYPRLRRADVTELIMKGIEQLQKEGIISRSTSKFSNGRRWRFNNRVPDLLEKVAQVDKLTKAVAFKRELDAAFRTAGAKQRVTYVTNDGMMLALLNMQACGRLRVETTGQPHVPLGHEPGNYETRKYTKKYMHFRVDMVPTDTYLFDDHPQLASFRDRLRAAEPPSEGPGGAIPVWCDVFGKVDGSRWLRYLAAVLLTLASRGSMRADELVKTLKPTIMLFEAELVLGWAAKLDCLEPQMEGLAPAVKEWWWMALEAQKERLDNAGKPRKMLPGGRRRMDGQEGRGEEGLY